MTQPLFARWAGRLLESQSNEAADETRPVDDKERHQAIEAIEQAIRERGRRKARARWAFGLSAAAAAILCVGAGTMAYRTRAVAPTLAVGALQQGPQHAEAAESERPALTIVKDGARVVAGDRITARGGNHALLAFSTGTELSVEDGGDMSIVEGGRHQIFALTGGELRARVAKLVADERFVVRTPDAEIEVRGTSFSVALAPSDPACGNGSVTRVAVEEGVVVIRHPGPTPGARIETRVAKGEEWPVGCDLSFERADTDTSADPSVVVPNAPGARRPHPRQRASASSLAEQNDLFAEALAFKNAGQHATAVAAFERFTAKYPSSNLAENAAVERMKLLLVDDRPRGLDAARQYLRRYPGGFAQADARAALAGSP